MIILRNSLCSLPPYNYKTLKQYGVMSKKFTIF